MQLGLTLFLGLDKRVVNPVAYRRGRGRRQRYRRKRRRGWRGWGRRGGEVSLCWHYGGEDRGKTEEMTLVVSGMASVTVYRPQ